MFLQSKDDSLLLQIGALVQAIILWNPDADLKQLLPIIYGGEAIEDLKSFCKIKT